MVAACQFGGLGERDEDVANAVNEGLRGMAAAPEGLQGFDVQYAPAFEPEPEAGDEGEGDDEQALLAAVEPDAVPAGGEGAAHGQFLKRNSQPKMRSLFG